MKYYFLFSLEWIIYYSIAAMLNMIRGVEFLFNSIPLFALLFIAYIAKKYLANISLDGKFAYFLFAFVLCDQLIKILIRNNIDIGSRFYIIPNYLYLGNEKNEFGSWLASIQKVHEGFFKQVIGKILVSTLLYVAYRKHIEKNGKNSWNDISALLLLSGAVSSVIDAVIWGGSTDYIGIKASRQNNLTAFIL